MAFAQGGSRNAHRLASYPGTDPIQPLNRRDTVGTTRSTSVATVDMALAQGGSRNAHRLASHPGTDPIQPLNRRDTVGTTRSAGYVKALTPQQYVDAISEHARQTTTSSPFPGYNFENLANYLRRDLDPKPSGRNHSRTLSMQRDASTSSAQKFPFLSVYKLNASGSLEGPAHYDDPSQLLSNCDKQSPNVVFLRGKPTSRWLSTVGADYQIDPEFFNRHLDFRSVVGRLDYYSSPSLPSAQPLLIQLPYITIGRVENATRQANQHGMDGMRLECAEKLGEFQKAIHQRFEFDDGLGESLVRDFHLHDDLHFAIEQRISVALNRVSGTWQLFIWLDTGKPLAEGPDGPWQSFAADMPHTSRGRTRFRVYPTIQVKPSIALKSHLHHVDINSNDRRTHDYLTESASHLATSYGTSLDAATMAADPFFALHDIFTFVAFSYRQYLNMLEQTDARRTRLALGASSPPHNHPNPSQWDSTNILHDRAVLEEHITHLRYIKDIIDSRGSPAGLLSSKYSWPRSSNEQQEKRATEAAKLLEKHFKDLESQADRLLARYREGMIVLMNRATVAEANKSLAQAKEVAKLTKLAFVYIPLSFTASFFGMNVSPLNGNIGNSGGNAKEVGLWVWFVVSAPVLIVSLCLMIWDVSDIWAWCKGMGLKMWAFVAKGIGHGNGQTETNVKQDDEGVPL